MVDYCVKLRGLPWSCRRADILKFFNGVKVKGNQDGVHLCYGQDCRPNGEGYVILESQDDFNRALKYNRMNIGERYIDLIPENPYKAGWYIKRHACGSAAGETVVKMCGLPPGVTKGDIALFFAGLDIAPNGIYLLTDDLGCPTGDAFVQFVTQDVAERAREEKNRERIGHSYVEIFKSSTMEANAAIGTHCRGSFMRQVYCGRDPYPPSSAHGQPAPLNFGAYWSDSSALQPQDRSHDAPRHSYYQTRKRNFVRDLNNSNCHHRAAPYPLVGVQPRYNTSTRVPLSPRAFQRDRYLQARPSTSGISSSRCDCSKCDHSHFERHPAAGFSVHMRGLPYECSELQVYEFFSPLRPVSVRLERLKSGKASGDGVVEFASREDAHCALKKDRERIGHRYIELYMKDENSSEQYSPPSLNLGTLPPILPY